MIPWMKENGFSVYQEHGCVMSMKPAIMEKMNMPVDVARQVYIIMGGDMFQLWE
jgi:uncharacterized protein YabE (DUF348 family)